MNDFLDYMQCDPYFRHDHYGELTFSMLYAYSEKFVLVFSHDEVVHGKVPWQERCRGTPRRRSSRTSGLLTAL